MVDASRDSANHTQCTLSKNSQQKSYVLLSNDHTSIIFFYWTPEYPVDVILESIIVSSAAFVFGLCVTRCWGCLPLIKSMLHFFLVSNMVGLLVSNWYANRNGEDSRIRLASDTLCVNPILSSVSSLNPVDIFAAVVKRLLFMTSWLINATSQSEEKTGAPLR